MPWQPDPWRPTSLQRAAFLRSRYQKAQQRFDDTLVEAFAAANEEMSAAEYDQWHSYGRLPERLWPAQIERLKAEYMNDQIYVWELEDQLDQLMGIRT